MRSALTSADDDDERDAASQSIRSSRGRIAMSITLCVMRTQRDRGGLRSGGEDDRDGERPPVGAQEPEQTGERVQVRVLFAVHR